MAIVFDHSPAPPPSHIFVKLRSVTSLEIVILILLTFCRVLVSRFVSIMFIKWIN